MSKRLQLRRGTTSQHSSFIGAPGEVTVNTDDWSLRVHDGSTVGGVAISGEGGGGGGDTIIVEGVGYIPIVTELPATGEVIGEVVLYDDVLWYWDGTEWVSAKSFLTPDAPSYVNIVTDLDTDGTEVGQTALFEGVLYYWDGTEWLTAQAFITPDATEFVEVVSVLPTEDNFEGRTVFLTTDNKLYKYTQGAFSVVVQAVDVGQEVADGSITTAKFAAGINPVEVFDALPTGYNGRTIFLTTDGKIYRYFNQWTSAVPVSDLSGQIGADQIAANSITSDKILANSITTGKIAAGAINADQIAAGAVLAEKIAAGTITSDRIAANAITTTQLATNSITSTKIATDAITAGKIAAGVVTATQLSASAVTADKIATNAITAAKISAGAVGASQIAAGVITADKISASGLDASVITSGTITANVIYGGKIQLVAESAGTSSFTTTDNVWGSQSTAFSLNNSSSTYTLAAIQNKSGNGSAVYGYCSSTSQTGAAVAGLNEGTTGSFGGYFRSRFGMGVVGITGRGDAQWGLYTDQKAYVGGGVSPFTGSHISYSNRTDLKVGQLVYSVDAWCVDINQTFLLTDRTTTSKEKRVAGVVSWVNDDVLRNLKENPLVARRAQITGPWSFKPEAQPYIDMLIDGQYKEVTINSLGEGGILVCSDNGDISNGDYLCSADTAGYAMRQEDDILHNYTVAKALEDVVWANEPNNYKLIGCTYHCG